LGGGELAILADGFDLAGNDIDRALHMLRP
jgi:hypothetical protein